MLLSRDRGWRLPATATVLLGLLFALLLCSTGSTSSAGPAGPAVTVAQGDGPAPVAVAAAGPVKAPPGCGKGAPDDDNGAHPGTPPRGGSSYELLPALHQAHAPSGSWFQDGTAPHITPERGPPPLAAPSPEDLSILRV